MTNESDGIVRVIMQAGLALIAVSLCAPVQASHFRYGSVTWVPAAGNSVRVLPGLFRNGTGRNQPRHS